MRILKTLIHNLTDAQRSELGAETEIVELKAIAPELATFLANTSDNDEELQTKASELVGLCKQYDAVLLPCGSPKFAWILSQLWNIQAKPLFAHSVRASIEKEVDKFQPIADEPGKFQKLTVVEKAVVFNHIRWF
jgi:hypothetical protein